jgi:translation initiation factor 2 subunit 2
MSFEEMLIQVYEKLDASKIEHKLVVPKPIVNVTTTNTFWKNAKSVMKVLKRPPDHIIEFMIKEIGQEITWRTSNKNDGIVIKNKVGFKKISSVISKYITNFVSCRSCSSANTRFKLEKSIRSYRLICKSCETNYII